MENLSFPANCVGIAVIAGVVYSTTAELVADVRGTNTVPPDSPASGPSLFWAIAALALYAMTQRSHTGYWVSGDTFNGLLWPHRSSPIICLADTILEIDEVVKQKRQQETSQGGSPSGEGDGGENDEREQSSVARYLLQLAMFVFGVVPQAVKLFSVRGIRRTQWIAAAFLFSSLWGLFRSAPSSRGRRRARKRGGGPTWSLERVFQGDRGMEWTIETLYLMWLQQAMALLGAWRSIGEETKFGVEGEVWRDAIIPWTQTVCYWTTNSITIYAIVTKPALILPDVRRRTKTLMLAFVPWAFASTLGLWLPEKEKGRHFGGIVPLIIFAIACFFLARLMKILADWMKTSVEADGIEADTTDSPQYSERQSSGELRQDDLGHQRDGDIGMQPLASIQPDTSSNHACHTTPSSADPNAASEVFLEISLEQGPNSSRSGDSQGASLQTVPNMRSTPAPGEAAFPKRLITLFTGTARDMGSVLSRVVTGYIEIWIFEPTALILSVSIRYPIESWVAFTLLNLGTAMVYYLVVFDGKNTWAPAWSQALG